MTKRIFKLRNVVTVAICLATTTSFVSCKKDNEAKKPVITIGTHPKDAAVTAGSISGSLTVTATVTEGAKLTYQWYKNTNTTNTGGTAVSGATSASFAIPADLTAAASPYYYFCEVSATGGATKVRSNVATVTVNPASSVTPVITINLQPVAATVVYQGSSDNNLIIAAGVLNGTTISYQWYSNTSASNDGGNAIAGASGTTYVIPATLTAAGSPYYYYCVVSSPGAASVPSNVATVTVTIQQDGTEEHPFLVSSAELLKKAGSGADGWTLDKHYLQTVSFTLSGTWTPIGTDAEPFTGVYDGGGYSITGLSIPSASADFQGLFGYIGTDGVVRNVALKSVNMNSTESEIGGIAGHNSGLIENCYVTGTVSGSVGVGGVAGYNYFGAVIKNCYTTCTLTGNDHSVGGIAGQNYNTIANCYAAGKITGTNYVGGIVGISVGTVSLCVALNNEVTATNASGYVGRVAAYNDGGALTNNFARALGMTLKQGTSTVMLTAVDKDVATIHGADAASADTHGATATTWWSAQSYISTNWSLANSRLPWLKTTGGTPFDEAQTPEVLVSPPDGSADNPFNVSSAALLAKVGSGADGWTRDKHYRQTVSFTISGNWTPIGTGTTPFTGTYDGEGFSITGLTISSPSAGEYQGLFGYIGTGGVVRNVALKDVNINFTLGLEIYEVGGIAGQSRGLIENCYVTGTVSGYSRVGGVAGLSYGTIQNCYTTCTVTVTGISSAGGIAGQNYNTIANCYATGNISGPSYVGGISGGVNDGTGTVSLCVALNKEVAATIATGAVGRVVGNNDAGGTLTNNFARADGMTLKRSGISLILMPMDIGGTTIHGANVPAADSHGATAAVFWSAGASSSLWSIDNGRLPYLKTTTGAAFDEEQKPTVN